MAKRDNAEIQPRTAGAAFARALVVDGGMRLAQNSAAHSWRNFEQPFLLQTGAQDSFDREMFPRR